MVYRDTPKAREIHNMQTFNFETDSILVKWPFTT